MPALFDDLAISLRGADVGGVAPGANEDARTHGHHRWLEKYDVAELLREVAIVRRIFLLSVVPAFAARNSDFSCEVKKIAKRIIHEFFDNMVTRSVDQYVVDQKTELLRATEELSLANQSLCKANENLERVDQLRLLLTRNVSHEIRNIANAMSGAINVLADQEGDPLHDEMVAVCKRSIEDMQQLLHQLLDYSALLAGGEKATMQVCSLRDLCHDVKATFKPVVEQHGLTFKSSCVPDIPISSDYRKLKQIASNLILSAIKYRKPKGAGSVEFSCEQVNPHEWNMVVADTGIGMSPEDVKMIFTEFQRGAAVDNIQGTGLGLAITKQLAELLGGRVEVTSTPGEGSRFDVRFLLNSISD